MASSISLLHVVECPVCLLKYDLPDRVPKILGCGHTFCLCCLRELASGGDMQCPTCRGHVSISVGDLASNHGIITLLESICPDCKDHQKTEKCLHCDVTLCPSCCQEHLTTWTADTKHTLSQLQTNIESLSVYPEVTTSLIQSVYDECHDQREEINRHYAEKIQELLQHQLQLSDQLRNIDRSQQTKINEILAQSTSNREAKQRCKDRLNKISELLDGGKLTFQIVSNVTRDIEDITGGVEPIAEMKDDLELCDETVLSSKNATTVTDDTSHSHTEIIVQGISSTLDYYKRISHSTYIMSGISTNKNNGTYLHMAVSPVNGTIYVIDSGGSRTVHISDMGKHMLHILTNKQPRGVSVDSSGKIVVTNGSCSIQYFTSNGTPHDEVGTTGSSTGCFDGPNGIAYGPKNELYVADGDNMRVQVRQPGKGWAVHSVYNQKPIGVTLCPDGTLLVCTRSKKPELWHIGKDGSKTKINIKDDGITRDNDFGFSQIAIDKDGYILLADRGSHSILVVDVKGQLHCRIGQKGSLPGQFDNPAGIVLSRDGRIVVSEHGNKRIQIF